MYDFKKKPVLDVIRHAINRRCAKLAESPEVKREWTVNDACLGKFHLDGQYYRAIILGLDCDGGEATVSIAFCIFFFVII